MPGKLDDKQVRLAAFQWLGEQVALHGDVLPRSLLLQGFEMDGRRVPLVSAQGIFKPKVLDEIPLTITTTVKSPYADRVSPDGLMLYSYRGTDPNHRENAGLRKAMLQGTPLIYLHALMPSKYVAVWPVFIVGDDPSSLTFSVAIDDDAYVSAYERAEAGGLGIGEPKDDGRRQYVTSIVLKRLHQRGFRERVLDAYRQQCALCRLRHSELLDAAHIIPDGEPRGEPVVENGIALCKLHHAAFDGFFLGIRPDYVIEVRSDILEEDDGPMLLHGLQEPHGKRILLPRSKKSRPGADRLEVRYDRFLEAGQNQPA
ncbi:MAG: HNH endonuclease [Candidatus Eisenbacteria sp.]|nr:HNH endonuclease [Candidatus Eisenbacteria bacterium]